MPGPRLRAVLVLAGLVLAGSPAHAQLGSVANPPPQRLFNFGQQRPKLDDGLGTMAERRARLARDRNGRVVRPRTHTTTR